MEALVHITGYAGSEVEIRGNGTVSAFRLACTPRVRTKGEWADGNTTWIEVSCFRLLAEHVAASVRKGDPWWLSASCGPTSGRRTAKPMSAWRSRLTWSLMT